MRTFTDIQSRLSPHARVCGAAIRDTCPACQGAGSLSLTQNADRSPKLVCHRCRCPMGDLIRALGVPNKQAKAKVLSIKPRKDDDTRRAEARSIWRAAAPISGTIAEAYLRSRGIKWPLPATLRFHRSVRSVEPPFKSHGALVGAMTKGYRELHAVYVIYLDGSAKAELEHVKIFRGCPSGASVHLAPLRGDSLTICEGVETGLSLIQIAADPEPVPVWACGSTAGIVNFEVPAGIRTLYIAVDIDKPRPGQTMGDGEIAARKLVERLNRTRPEIDVWLQWPDGRRLGRVKCDFNYDLVAEQ